MGIITQSGHRTRLERLDAIIFEQNLKESLERLVPFESHSILFPRKNDAAAPAWSEEEKRLLLPIPGADGGVLGIFVARGVDDAQAKQLLPLWDGIAPLISDNLLNFKKSLCDPVTGLFTRHYLLSTLERDLDSFRDPSRRGVKPSCQMKQRLAGALPLSDTMEDGSDAAKAQDDLPRRGSSAVLTIRLAGLRDVVREFGYQFADQLMAALADSLLAHCPEQAVAARTGDLEFAVGLRSATKKSTERLAAELAEALGKAFVEHPLRKERVGILAAIGFALFPQDMAGADFLRPASEQARILLRKARLAAALADEDDWNGTRRTMGFGKILAEGGRVVHVLPLSRVMVSLGANMHAREGQRFSVWSMQRHAPDGGGKLSATPLYKGEVALMDVHENTSQAEIIHLGDPSWPLEAGDRLVLLPDEQGGSKPVSSHDVVRHDPATGLLRHGDFLAQWAMAREQSDSFLLALTRIVPMPEQVNRESAEAPEAPDGTGASERLDGNLSQHPDQVMSEVAALFRETFGEDSIGGRYGLNSLVFFHPSLTTEEAAKAYEKLSYLLEDRLRLHMAVGIAPHPFQDFRKSDALENCQKALEYGLLLPSPHTGVLDSLALNISADKRFSQGDTFAAIREYQRALWADDKNALAWNSLGICYAGLGRLAEAEEFFSKALGCDPSDAMALYNLGYICQSRGERDRAVTYFHSCLEHAPAHLFALVRLGQMAEAEGNKKEARSYFEQAAKLPGGQGVTFRHFARLSLAEGNEEDAREHLHAALLHDPQDAVSLQMLAGLYLDAGEDPDMALSLARQSVSLRPELKSGWFALSRALEALGRNDQAREARLKSGQI